MVEKKLATGYTLAQIGAFAMLMGQAEQQPQRGWFKSLGVLRAAMDCMVEEHGARARASQHVSFLLEHGDVVKGDGGYYVEGWEEWQEGDHTPHARMELVRGRRGRPGDPESPGARRQRRLRAKKAGAGGGQTDGEESVTNPIDSDGSGDATNPIDSDASPDSANCDARYDARDLDHSRKQISRKQIASPPTSETTPPTPPGELVAVLDGEYLSGYEAFLAELSASTGRQHRADALSRGLYADRRRDGWPAADLVAAARGVAMSKFHMGLNDNGLPHNDPASVLRSKSLPQFVSWGAGEMGIVREELAEEQRQREIREWARRVDADRQGRELQA